MKKTTLKILMMLLLLVIVGCAIALCACSDDFFTEFGDVKIQPNAEGDAYIVVGPVDKKTSDVIIPSHYNDLPITTIAKFAFSGCSNLTSVTIPDTIEQVDSQAFSNCDKLVKVNISDIAKWCNIDFLYYIESNPLYYAKNLYLNDELVTNLVIPDSVTTIKSAAFINSNIKRLTLSQNLTEVGYDVFNGSNLETVYWDAISLTDEKSWNHLFDNCLNLTTVVIGDNVKIINGALLEGKNSIDKIYVSSIESLCNIDYKVEGNEFIFPSILTNRDLYIDDEIVTELIIPSAVKTIKDGTFYACSSIQSVTIPDTVISIEDNSFSHCRNLTTAKLNARTISGFNNCENLSIIEFGNNVERIEENAFSECKNLDKVLIPDNVSFLGQRAFYRCGELSIISIGIGVKEISQFSNVFSSTTTKILAIPAWLLSSPGLAVGCVDILIITAGDSITSDCLHVSMGTNSIYIAESVKNISADVFYQGFIHQTGTNTIYCQATSKPAGWEYNWNRLKLYFKGEERKYLYWDTVWGCDSLPEEITNYFTN